MRTRRTAITILSVLLGISPIAVFAACQNYPLSPSQQDYLAGQDLPIAVPEGDVPTIQRCDVNVDNVVDINDIRAITMKRNRPAAHPDDPMDWDKNHVINIFDARGCQRACTLPRCATPPEPEPVLVGGVSEEADCYQTEDFDGDGNEDFAGMFEYTGGEKRGGEWTLDVVFLYEDEAGNTQHITYPYSGQHSKANGKLHHHLSMQPSGEIDLMPGSLTIDKPAVVSYREGRPEVIYYWKDGILNRAFYGVDD